MTEIKSEASGGVAISDEVLAVIVGTAALETDGVCGLTGWHPGQSQKSARRQMLRVVGIHVTGHSVKADLRITAKFGSKLHEIAHEVQQRVKTEIESMTGLTLAEVNVTVGSIVAQTPRK